MAIPDAQIHPVATAAAAQTVAKHQDPQELVFWAGWFCPFVQRTWIALEEKKIPYQYKEVNPYKKEAHFLAINPKGLVPAIEYKGRALYESLILCEFLEDAFPDHTPLLPSDPSERAYARIWIDHLNKTFLPANQRLTQAQTKEKQDEAREEVYSSLRKFAEKIKGPYFLGEQFSLVDVAVAPWIARDYVVREHRGFKRGDVSEAWQKYAELVEKRESLVSTTSDKEHLQVIYNRYLKDEAQSEAAKAVRAGRRPQNLAIHLKRAEGPTPCEAYVGWTGLASASSLTQFQSGSAEKGLETIEVDPQYAQSLGFNEGDTVEIGLLHDLSSVSMVITEPATSDDWEIIEIHASHVESTLLSQVRVARAGQELNVWVMGRTRIRLKPPVNGPVLLTNDTEVSIAPKPHRTAASSSAKTAVPVKPAASSIPEESKSSPLRPVSNSQTLRVLPSRLCSTPIQEYAGSEILGYVSPATFDALRNGKEASGLACTIKRLLPPLDPASTNSTLSSQEEPAPVPKSLNLGKAGGSEENHRDEEQKEAAYVGPLEGLPDSHIVFVGSPDGVLDWDLVVLLLSETPSVQSQPPQIDGIALRSPSRRKHFLAGVDDILNKTIAFCLRKFAMHALSPVIHGVPSLLITGRTGSGKTSIVKTIARAVQDDAKTFTYTHYIDVSRHSEQPVATLKPLFQYWFDKAAFHKPSILILDNLDKLFGTESEHTDSFRTRHLTELFVSIFSSSARTAMSNARGIVLLATAGSSASLHPMLHTAHMFQEVVNLQPPNKNARRDILSSIVHSRLEIAQDIRQDPSSPLNFTALATQTEGYSATDLKDLVSRAMHQYAIKASQGDFGTAYLSPSDFEAAQANFVPLSLRDAKLQTSDVAWADIGGLHDTRRILRETLEWPTKYGPIFAQSPLRLRSGLLLYGHPGCGKTLLASAVAKECGLNFISVKGPEILNKYIGASEKSVRDLFERASAAKPCVLFFDEFESIAPKRGHDSTGVTDRVVNQMLTQMDGAEGLDGVYVLAATSRPDLIDSALLRPGRLDKSLLCGMPDFQDRKEILSVVGQKIALSMNVDLDEVADRTEGFSGADLQALLYNAHLETIHSSLDRPDEATQLHQEEVVVGYTTFGGGASLKTASKAEEMALQKRLRRIQASSHAAETKVAKHASSKGKSKEHAVTMEDIEKALGSMRPSVTADERSRLDRIYRAFLSDREGNIAIPPEGGSIGSRATLG